MTQPARPAPGDALIIVDVQNDFLPGGALAVPGGDAVIPLINRVIDAFVAARLPVYATRDWHPGDHCSFETEGGIWPPHCVARTQGAAFADALALPSSPRIVSKATRPQPDAYSGFDGTDLAYRLSAQGVRCVIVCGLATDYCVLNTVLDACAAGLRVRVLEDAIRAVEVAPGDGDRAIERMRAAGATFTTTDHAFDPADPAA